jgi:hypothetical protein
MKKAGKQMLTGFQIFNVFSSYAGRTFSARGPFGPWPAV